MQNESQIPSEGFEPFSAKEALTCMISSLLIIALLAGWLVLQTWILPKLGVPT